MMYMYMVCCHGIDVHIHALLPHVHALLAGLPAQEIHLCGHESAIPLIRSLAGSMGDEVKVSGEERGGWRE